MVSTSKDGAQPAVTSLPTTHDSLKYADSFCSYKWMQQKKSNSNACKFGASKKREK